MCQNTSMRSVYHPAAGELSLPSVLYALSDPIRLQIVRALAQSSERACRTFCTPLAKTTLSHHFKTLREAGIIAIRAEGTQRLNSLRRADLEARFPGLLDAVLVASEREAAVSVNPSDMLTTERHAPEPAVSS